MNKCSELCSWFKTIFLSFWDCITNAIHLCHPLKLVSSLVFVTNPGTRFVNPSDIKAKFAIFWENVSSHVKRGYQTTSAWNSCNQTRPLPDPGVRNKKNSFFWIRLDSRECHSQLEINLPWNRKTDQLPHYIISHFPWPNLAIVKYWI